MTRSIQNQGAPKKCLLMLGDSLVAYDLWGAALLEHIAFLDKND